MRFLGLLLLTLALSLQSIPLKAQELPSLLRIPLYELVIRSRLLSEFEVVAKMSTQIRILSAKSRDPLLTPAQYELIYTQTSESLLESLEKQIGHELHDFTGASVESKKVNFLQSRLLELNREANEGLRQLNQSQRPKLINTTTQAEPANGYSQVGEVADLLPSRAPQHSPSQSAKWATELATDQTAELAKAHQRHKLNQYNYHRSATLYLNDFGNQWLQDIKALTVDSHWLDAGAGSASAMKELAIGVRITPTETVQVKSRGLTALSIEQPYSLFVNELYGLNQQGRQFRYLSGRYLEDYRASEIGQVDLITDLYGPFAYTARIDLVLKKYLELLKIGGKAYIRFEPSKLTIDGNPNGLGEYLNHLGQKIEWIGINQPEAIRIEKIRNLSEHDIPELSLDHYQDGTPPRRYFRSLPLN